MKKIAAIFLMMLLLLVTISGEGRPIDPGYDIIICEESPSEIKEVKEYTSYLVKKEFSSVSLDAQFMHQDTSLYISPVSEAETPPPNHTC